MKKFIAVLSVALLPVFAQAQGGIQTSYIDSIIRYAKDLLATALPFIIALAVVWFVWNIFRYVVAGGDDAKEAAKTHILWGIIGLFVMVSVWGIVNVVASTLGINSGGNAAQTPQLPSIPSR
jgi:uncharacterized membrane protein